MRKLKPEIRNVVASVLVASVALFGTYGISKAVDSDNTSNQSEQNAIFSVEQVDGDTVKICLDNIDEIVKAAQFTLNLDDKVKLENVRALSKDNIASYEINGNKVDILVTSIDGLKQKSGKVELVKLDISPKDNSEKIDFFITKDDVNNYKYVSMDNTEHSISFSSNSGDITEEKTQVEFDKNKILPNDGENSEIETPENPDSGNNGGGSTKPENPDGGNNGGGSTTPENPDSGNNGGGSTTPEKPNNPQIAVITDVPNNHWAKYHIDKFVKAGYILGYGDGTFRPENKTTRAEFIKLVNRVYNFTEKGTQNFKDVKTTNWFYNDLLIAMKAGYINGYEDNTFRPNEPISREEACKILATVMNIKGDGKLNFKDNNSIADWAKKYVDALEDISIIGGYEDKTFRPKNNITRAEVVKILDLSTIKK